MFARLALLAPLLLISGTAAPAQPVAPGADAKAWAERCGDWDDWDKPGPPFRVFGNTYYVGTCGISAILITTDDGLALIDTGTEQGAEVVLANIRALGFDPADIKLLLASHEHFDHVGGMARMLEATGADLVFSEVGIEVLSSGQAHPDDPQFGMHDPMRPVSRGMPYSWGNAPYLIDYFGISPVETPGHTPGAMSWHWESCEGTQCKMIVYADSLSPVSSDSYRFSDHPSYVAAFRESIAKIAALDCDILLTPHPSASNLPDRLRGAPPLIDRDGCKNYAADIEVRLDERLFKEAGPE